MTTSTNTKTSDEASATTLTGAEFIRGVQNGSNVKITVDQIVEMTYQSPAESKGDIVVRDVDGADHRLAIGIDGQFLVVDSTTDLGVKWIDPTTVGATNPPLVNAQTGTAYTLALTDAPASSANTGIVTMDNAAANVLTIASDATVDFPVGTTIQVIQLGAGQTSIAGDGAGVTVESASSLTARAQLSILVAAKIAANLWVIAGDMA